MSKSTIKSSVKKFGTLSASDGAWFICEVVGTEVRSNPVAHGRYEEAIMEARRLTEHHGKVTRVLKVYAEVSPVLTKLVNINKSNYQKYIGQIVTAELDTDRPVQYQCTLVGHASDKAIVEYYDRPDHSVIRRVSRARIEVPVE